MNEEAVVLDLLEPEVKNIGGDIRLFYSMAISLKRIADLLDRIDSGKLDDIVLTLNAIHRDSTQGSER